MNIITIDLINLLYKNNINVKVVGRDWEDSLIPKEIILKNISYERFPEIYNKTKIYINLSLIEGGPISLLEAMACGCFILSTPSGFILDFDLKESDRKLININQNIDKTFEILNEILLNFSRFLI